MEFSFVGLAQLFPKHDAFYFLVPTSVTTNPNGLVSTPLNKLAVLAEYFSCQAYFRIYKEDNLSRAIHPSVGSINAQLTLMSSALHFDCYADNTKHREKSQTKYLTYSTKYIDNTKKAN